MPRQLPSPSCVRCSLSRPCSPCAALGPPALPLLQQPVPVGAEPGARGCALPEEQAPLARPAPRAALLELFVCLFITQVFLKIIRRGQPPSGADARGVISVQIFLR